MIEGSTCCLTDDRSADNYEADDRFEFDPEECSLVHGKWVFNRSIKPLYSDRTCSYLDRQVSCVKNGRPDSDYRHWEWQPDDCMLPRSVILSVLICCHQINAFQNKFQFFFLEL